jgi:hypothetical protein
MLLPELHYAANRQAGTSSHVTTASILVMISSIDFVSAGEMISKQQSHFGQRQT